MQTPLRQWQRMRLALLRSKQTFNNSPYSDRLTLLTYTFPSRNDSSSFDLIECALLQTWDMVGTLPTVIVANSHFPKLDNFVRQHSDVSVQIEPTLIPRSITSMSYDCITRLHKRFSTEYVLIVQDDGFPLRCNIGDFIGKYDFIGAPSVRPCWRKILNTFGLLSLNGGFSLRSRRMCHAVAQQWEFFWRHLIPQNSRMFAEDNFYTLTARLNPVFWRHYKVAKYDEAIRFSFDSLDGLIEPCKDILPFGFHGKSADLDYLLP